MRVRERKQGITVSFIAAASGSGKTTLIEKIVRLLKAHGLRVAVVKHASKGFDLDRTGKDSWRFEQAGADSVVVAAPGRLAVFHRIDSNPGVEELDALVDADIILHEGFKRTAVNRIEVFRSGVSGEQPLCMSESGFIALVSDTRFDVSIPRFDINDAQGVAGFLLKRIGA